MYSFSRLDGLDALLGMVSLYEHDFGSGVTGAYRAVSHCCPDGITAVVDGIVLTLEANTRNYGGYAALDMPPFLADHGVRRITSSHEWTGPTSPSF